MFRDAGAIIVAHRNVRGWIHSENIHLMGDRITPAQRAQIAALPEPDLTTDKPLTIWLGARRVEVRPVEGHTGGDLAVAVPDAKVLFCGDLLWHGPANIVDGTVSRWIATVAAFQRLPAAGSMTFVPGHGDLSTAADVARFQAYLADLSSLTAQGRRAGLRGDALVAEVVPKLAALHPDYPTAARAAPNEVPFMEAELAGTKRVPTPVPD